MITMNSAEKIKNVKRQIERHKKNSHPGSRELMRKKKPRNHDLPPFSQKYDDEISCRQIGKGMKKKNACLPPGGMQRHAPCAEVTGKKLCQMMQPIPSLRRFVITVIQ